MSRAAFLASILGMAIVACSPSPNRSNPTSAEPTAATQPARTFVTAVATEPKTLGARIIGQPAVALALTRRIVNADLALVDTQSNFHPYLAEALPRLNTDSWKVFPDGKMETTYRLKPNLVWHDGTLLTADAFVFSWEIYSTPDFGQASSMPIKVIADVTAPDSQTVLIRWTQPYAAAGALQSLGTSGPFGLPALGRHILSPSLESGPQALINHPYWTTSYVGLGPYKLDRWEPGAFMEASAFDRHALGPPKIQRITIRFLPDANQALASMLAGEVQMATDRAIGIPQITSFTQQRPPGPAIVIHNLNPWLAGHFQGRRSFVSPVALYDVRVRQALAHAVDRAAINDALFEGLLPIADSLFPPTSDLGRAADAAVTKYPFDRGRSAQFMADAGFIKSADGFFASPSGEKFSAEIRTDTPSFVDIQTAMAGGWRQAGFGFTELVVPAAQSQDPQVKATYPGILLSSNSSGEIGLNSIGTANIPIAENQWRGAAWDGYSSPAIDRLIAAFSEALEPVQRNKAAADFARQYSADVPAISLFFPVTQWVFTDEMKGIRAGQSENNVAWNIHEWDFANTA
ncbi:MAG TPA: ABC transporter substrate-binding protein [Chloroflexota bacterium]